MPLLYIFYVRNYVIELNKYILAKNKGMYCENIENRVIGSKITYDPNSSPQERPKFAGFFTFRRLILGFNINNTIKETA